jgi:DNA polymerase-3 subunit epsilon
LGEPLAAVTFCVVDLETTGTGAGASITEIGAVKVRGGEVVGEFQTLVNPGSHIPASITVLTGISDSMIADAPRLENVLPSFLAFSEGCVLVAHNASFDVGFLKRACAQLGYEWPKPVVIDTVALARQALLRDEVPNLRLATLASHFHAQETPNHRALADARATMDVLHGLLERAGGFGVDTLEDLREFSHGPQQRRAKRWLADGLPQAPGVYRFVADLPDRSGAIQRQVLYVGKSRNIRNRVRSYFTAAEKRSRIHELLRIATGVEATVCRTELEAEILELRLIAAHEPRYNRRSKFPQRQWWVKLTNEPFPRLGLVRKTKPGDVCLGPFHNSSQAEDTMRVLCDAFQLRPCKARLSPNKPTPACALAELGRCLAPCQLQLDTDGYAQAVAAVRQALTSDIRPALRAAQPGISALTAQERFEEAAEVVKRLDAFARSVLRHHRLSSLVGCAEIVAAYRNGSGWEVHVIRQGRLAGAATARPGESPIAAATAAQASADTTLAGNPALTEETQLIANWLERPGVRLIAIDGDWSWPLRVGVDSLSRAVWGDDPPAFEPPGPAESVPRDGLFPGALNPNER